jgi:hypothetical protein
MAKRRAIGITSRKVGVAHFSTCSVLAFLTLEILAQMRESRKVWGYNTAHD